MDNYDQYAALRGASSPTADRIKNLNAYAALFDKMGMGRGNVISSDVNGRALSYGDVGDGVRARNAMDWANQQVGAQSAQQMLNAPPPDYFSNQQPQTQPQAPQNDFTNHLRMMLQSPLRRGFTMGVRG